MLSHYLLFIKVESRGFWCSRRKY